MSEGYSEDYSTDDENQLDAADTLGDGSGSDVDDELDRGYSPPEKWSAAQGFGNTPYEEARGETLDQRLAQEEPDVDEDAAVLRSDDENDDGADGVVSQAGDERAGRLTAADYDADGYARDDRSADDVGIDGAAASAEEAAMHVIDDSTGDDAI